MSEFLLFYERPNPTTWVYLSSFLTIGLYFVFHRFWSVRNLDILLVLLLAPGLLMVQEGRRRHLREMESGDIAFYDVADPNWRQPNDASELVSAYPSPQVGQDAAGNPDDPELAEEGDSFGIDGVPETPPADTAPPRIQDETRIPLRTEPEALDERLESTTLHPEQIETDTEQSAKRLQRAGFIWLFLVELLILGRLMIDPVMNRRPMLDPNLTVGGSYFISISLFIFMMVNVATSTPRARVWQGPELGPGYVLMHQLPTITTRPVSSALGGERAPTEDEVNLGKGSSAILAKVLAISAHLAIVVGLILIGNRHFGNLRSGVGCALLYLIVPYTAQYTGRVDHALPAALLLWAILSYRRPMIAGMFLGLAAGLVYYPLFLLPLWYSFYWRKGVRSFSVGVIVTLAILVAVLTFSGTDSLVEQLRRMFGLFAPTKEPRGIWGLGWDPRWRLPVIVAFGILSSLFAAWPSSKNLGTLIGCSAAVMVAVQFWHGYGGGLFIAWFLPLLLLTIFRPNLEDRVAVKVVKGRSWDRSIPANTSGRLELE
ncbi:DUF2029 domain-containing protein [Rhodopirellula sp. MGV]|uniref:DUF2029 domain-containing protein n=1 Tax=Rhodopirellula sp. MGV TaxID=2023130 RepID=UPI000B9611D8|nr:DUF2029 domain-containing protein [Rhodopirellula sp. MGV]OYP35939.1 hypothetical protein CGZ80_09215 [Rhodopirellula sp. MGV]PNY34885.1 hypothetical protein C2E31_21060 [Rhodopirellula baltica]